VFVPVALVVLAAAAIPHAGFAAGNLNFSGKFVHRGDKSRSDLDPEVTLEVVQTEQAIQITRADQGGKTSNRFLLNGAQEDCVSATGVPAKCKAQIKGKSLILETIIESKDQSSGALVHIRNVEQWQLSGDSKTLTVKLRVDFPGGNSNISSSEGQSVEDDKYIRQ
jgi:hypothetical protein